MISVVIRSVVPAVLLVAAVIVITVMRPVIAWFVVTIRVVVPYLRCVVRRRTIVRWRDIDWRWHADADAKGPIAGVRWDDTGAESADSDY
jgi:hypothetical protein